GGAWDPADYGTYTLAVQAGQVTNAGNASAPAGTMGTFLGATPQTFTVTSTADSTAAGTLRAAVTAANARVGSPDTIVFDNTFGGSNPARPVPLGTLGQLTITDPVTITGPAANRLTLSGNNARRVFNINNGASSSIAVTIAGLTVTGGSVGAGNRGG